MSIFKQLHYQIILSFFSIAESSKFLPRLVAENPQREITKQKSPTQRVLIKLFGLLETTRKENV